jgi:uncharacterized membrane protein
MNWRQWYSLTRYTKHALWVVPFIAIVLELVLTRALHELDSVLGWKLAGIGVQGAQAMLQAVVTMTLSFVVFTFGSLLVAIQVASGQLTPRIIATTLLRDDVVKYTVGLFVFTLLFAISALDRIETTVHQLVIFVAGGLGLICLAAFLYLIDYAARLLRPISILARVGEDGLAVIESVYPQLTQAPSIPQASNPMRGPPDRIISHGGTSQIILAVDVGKFVAEAQSADGIVEFIPTVGDFIAKDEPLFALYGGAAAIDDNRLRSAVSFGTERTMEQDPTFAFRILIDIGLKALSPAINDPTTAVLAIDQLHRLLRMVGNRHLRTDEISDRSGQLRVIFHTPNWEDFVHLSFSELRRCGADSLQVARRLRAMIANLIKTLPEHRHAALQEQMTLLDRQIESVYTLPEDLALARVPDSQGLGGTTI